MTRRIHVLPDALADQIAAGEVVERPASVVKEVVENALDAAATRVDVQVRNGGKTEIRVADDGRGMSREDAVLALDRHATSKIASEADLAAVRSFGFRGEALPSIAAVARLEIETAEAGDVGTRVRAAGGRITGVDDCARQGGTTVVVRKLFYNVPARSKFLKSAAVETRGIAETVTALALANPSTAFRLESNGRVLLELPAATDLASRVAALWGDEMAATLVPVEYAAGPLRVAGLVERPDAATTGPRRLYLFLSGRPFRDPGLVRAAERGYRTTVPRGTRPSLFLYLAAPEGTADVNVHPAKLEVRFRNRAGVEEAIEEAVRSAMGTPGSAATLDTAPALPQLRRPLAADSEHDSEADSRKQLAFFAPVDLGDDRLTVESAKNAKTGSERGSGDAGTTENTEATEDGEEKNKNSPTPPRAVEGAPATADVEDPPSPRSSRSLRSTKGQHDPPASESPTTQPVQAAGIAGGSLWQIHDTYILAETQGGLIIIDQHSAHERVLFQELEDGFARGGVASQRLLFPLTLRLSPAEYTVIEDVRTLLDRAGFEVEPFGSRTVIVHAAPAPHPYFDAERCLRDMLTELAEGSELTRSAKDQHDRIAMTFACKAAIKAGQPLSRAEMEELFQRLFATRLPYHDVHGRPTVIRLSLKELERRFGRHG